MKRLAIMLAFVALAFGAWYVYSPRMAVDELVDAIRYADSAALDRVIDFPVLRENLKVDLRKAIAGRVDDRGSGAVATIGAAIGGAVLDGVIEGVVTPGGLAGLLRGERPGSGRTSGREDIDELEVSIDRHGIARFLARVEVDDTRDFQPTLVFERQGIRWRLVRIEIESR